MDSLIACGTLLLMVTKSVSIWFASMIELSMTLLTWTRSETLTLEFTPILLSVFVILLMFIMVSGSLTDWDLNILHN